eukprot:GFYU01000143.1.p1 GENE.GFYU01000143.1~~GFYU01000143.1.p1  ORF type:complete len:359 (-),score=45.49 GFYU01000143.1:292-1368(-)
MASNSAYAENTSLLSSPSNRRSDTPVEQTFEVVHDLTQQAPTPDDDETPRTTQPLTESSSATQPDAESSSATNAGSSSDARRKKKREKRRANGEGSSSRSSRSREPHSIAPLTTSPTSEDNGGGRSTGGRPGPSSSSLAPTATAGSTESPVILQRPYRPVNVIVQEPDGSFCVGVDIEQAKIEARHGAAAASRQGESTPGDGLNAAYDSEVTQSILLELYLSARRRRSFVFLLLLEFFYLFLHLLGNMSQDQSHPSSHSSHGSGSASTYTLSNLDLVALMSLDLIGVTSAMQGNAQLLGIFIILSTINAALSPAITLFLIVRFMLLAMAVQVRGDLLTMRQRIDALLENERNDPLNMV